jgi:hypothetical protein
LCFLPLLALDARVVKFPAVLAELAHAGVVFAADAALLKRKIVSALLWLVLYW